MNHINKSKTFPVSSKKNNTYKGYNKKSNHSIPVKSQDYSFNNTTENNDYNTLCIPCIDINTIKSDIFKLFNKLNIGSIDRIDEVYNYTQKVKKIFIHIKEWNDNDSSIKFKEHMKNIGHVNIIYKFPLFWKCFISNVIK